MELEELEELEEEEEDGPGTEDENHDGTDVITTTPTPYSLHVLVVYS